MKPLLVGESNPHQSHPRLAMRYALHPDPPRASGWRLCHVIMGLDEETYLRSFAASISAIRSGLWSRRGRLRRISSWSVRSLT